MRARKARLDLLCLLALVSACSDEEGTVEAGSVRDTGAISDTGRDRDDDVTDDDSGAGDAGDSGTDDTADDSGTDDSTDTADDSGTDDTAGDIAEDIAEDIADDSAGDIAEDTAGDSGTDDTADDSGIDPACDNDRDGVASTGCGGTDCNDNNDAISPLQNEGCDFADNDCDGSVNEGLDCTFYAHTSNQLYRVDPFAGAATLVTSTPTLFDFDTATDGTLWGIGPGGLYRFDAGASRWVTVSELAGIDVNPNGFAINSLGVGFATAGSSLYRISLPSGAVTLIGDVGGGFSSSGDCVVDKSDALFMSSFGRSGDDLVEIDGISGTATLVGNIGHGQVYGLTAAWGFLFGLTSSGNVLEINPSTGRGTIVQTFSGKVWYGAASSAGR
jgi:hypothetical protein